MQKKDDYATDQNHSFYVFFSSRVLRIVVRLSFSQEFDFISNGSMHKMQHLEVNNQLQHQEHAVV
jgi:hypothetical protein